MPEVTPLEHRFSESDAPYPWAVGKTVKEAMDMNQGMMQTLQTFTPTVPNPQPPAPVQQPNLQGPPDPQLSYDNPAEYNRQLQAYINTQTTSQVQAQAQAFAQPIQLQLKQQARTLAAQDPKVKEIFEKYGHEIDTQMLSVDPQYCTVDSYIKVAKMIKGDHLDEFIDAAAKRQSQIGAGTISGDAALSPQEPSMPQDAIDKFWDADGPYVQRMKADGSNKARLRQAISIMKISPDEYIKSIERGHTISSLGGRVSETHNLIPQG